MLIFKAIHIIAIVCWFAALFYLPRLFVYHTQIDTKDNKSYERFLTMETRLYYYIACPALVLTLVFGTLTQISIVEYMRNPPLWLYLKHILVVATVVYHFMLGSYISKFKHRHNTLSTRFYRIFNEVPSIILILIVFLTVLKPFSG